jgi:simple sugar transport system permease protein
VASYHIQRADTLLQVGFFDIMNGRWEFSGREVTGGWFQGIDIDTAANFRNSIIWWLFFSVFFHIVMTRTRYGNSVFAVGGNIGAARAQGINVNRVKIMSFMLTAVLTGIAAVYETTRNPGVDPLKGQFYELDVIAMTVIGGALLSGGYGSIIGTILGALIYGMMQTGLVLVGMESRMFAGVVGTIILIAVVLNTYVRRIPTN